MCVTRAGMRLPAWQEDSGVRVKTHEMHDKTVHFYGFLLLPRNVAGTAGMKPVVIILLVLLALLQYRLWFSPGGLIDVNELEQTKQELIDENKRIRERNAALAAEVIDLQHGLEAVEERARSEMGMIKSDEVFYQIIGNPDTSSRELLSVTPLDDPGETP